MKLRVAQHYTNDEIRIGQAFESSNIDGTLSELRNIFAQKGITKHNYKDYFKRVTLVDADTL